jgi:hypothetical protein
VPLLVVAVMPKVKLMAVMAVAEVLAAGVTSDVTPAVAAMPAAGRDVMRGRKRGGGERNGGNGGDEEWSRRGHGGTATKQANGMKRPARPK